VNLATQARGDAALSDRLSDAGVSQAAFEAEPEPGLAIPLMLSSQPQVAIDSADRLVPDRNDALAPALAEHTNEGLVQVDVVRHVVARVVPKVRDLRAARSRVEEDPDKGGVSDPREALIGLADAEERSEFGFTQDRRRCLRQPRGLRPCHRRLFHEPLVERPSEESLAAPVAVVGRGGLEPIELIGHELLNASAISER
jgi:hypothetical protein